MVKGITILTILVLISLGVSIYSVVILSQIKKDFSSLEKDYSDFKTNYQSNILNTLGSCENIEEEGPSSSISCDEVCENQGMVCISAQSGSLPQEGNLDWIFQPVDCDITFALSDPAKEKLQCQCCSV